MRILVAGGTGMLGAPVVRRLVAERVQVRVLTRDAVRARELFGDAVEIAAGDVTRAESLREAVRDCTSLHVSLRGANDARSYEAVEQRGLGALLDAARDAGVDHVSYLSGAGKLAGNEHLLPARTKLAAEANLIASRIPATIFRATHFMESLDLFMRKGSATILGRQPHRYHYLAADDFARMVSRAHAEAPAATRTLYAYGPEAFTMREALERYMAALNPTGRISTLPLPLARVIARVSRNADLAFAASLFEAFAAIGEEGDPSEAQRLLGRPAVRLDDWLRSRGTVAA